MKKLIFLMLLILPTLCFSQEDTIRKEQEIIEEKSVEIIHAIDVPEYPGGFRELIKFLKKNLKYPRKALLAKKEDIVFVNFIVDNNGNILNPTINKRVGFGFDEEAIRLVKMMPKWEPVKQNGFAINCRHSLPIRFRLNKK